MKSSITAWVLAFVFLALSILFGCLYLAERHSLQRTQTELEMTEQAAAEFKSNVEAAVNQLESQSTAHDKASSVYGVYYCAEIQNYNKFDLRSDGTVALYLGKQDGGEMITFQKATWELVGNTVWIKKAAGIQKFTVEQDDLIDAKGNRWIHTH
jgi:hypothetical protein